MARLNIGFLASHGGSNMQAIIDAARSGALDANICAVISNNSDSGAMLRASREGIPHYHVSAANYPGDGQVAKAIIECFDRHGVDTVVLAGYMKILDAAVIAHFSGRVLNIHPALLPDFGGAGMYGMRVHEAVIKAGESRSGATVHLVDAEYDHGRILLQRAVPVLSGDTAETLAARVLAVEHQIYAEALQLVASGEIVI